jgi:hypothetical protein
VQAWVSRLLFLFVICLLISGRNLSADTVKATVYQVSGLAESAAPGSTSFSPMTVGEALPEGTTVRTGSDGKAVLTVTPGSAIEVGPNSKLKLNALEFAKSGGNVTQREAHIELTSGVVTALIDPSTPKITDFRIQTPQGGASARGTFYAVAVYQGKTYVSVKEGHVGEAPVESSKSHK